MSYGENCCIPDLRTTQLIEYTSNFVFTSVCLSFSEHSLIDSYKMKPVICSILKGIAKSIYYEKSVVEHFLLSIDNYFVLHIFNIHPKQR